MTRKQIQEKIDQIRGDQTISIATLLPSISSWLDEGNLELDFLSHDFMRDQILSDLLSYEGVVE